MRESSAARHSFWADKDLKLKATDQGFTVYRQYEALPGTDGKVDPDAVKQTEDGDWIVKAATNVKVTISLMVSDRANYVVVDDPLPAGFEGQNPKFATSVGALSESGRSGGGYPGSYGGDGWWWGWWYTFSHTDLRDDRMLLFADQLPAGVGDDDRQVSAAAGQGRGDVRTRAVRARLVGPCDGGRVTAVRRGACCLCTFVHDRDILAWTGAAIDPAGLRHLAGMNDSRLHAPYPLAHGTPERPQYPVVPLLWTLTAICAACTPVASDEGDGSTSTASTSTASTTIDPSDADESDSSSSTTTPDVTDGALDAGEDTLADGCWEYAGAIEYEFDNEFTYPFEPLGCPELPIPCGPVDLGFTEEITCDTGAYEFDQSTLADRDAIEAAGRCVLTALRDGTPAMHNVSMFAGSSSISTRYTVLDAGVLTYVESWEDLSGDASERYLGVRDAAWFDACLAAPDLEGLLPCLWYPVGDETAECGGVLLSPVDRSACIGETPTCP